MDSFILNFELFFRVKDYIKNGLDSKYLRDPDGQLCMLRKKARLGVLESAEPELPQSFPKEGFSDDLMKIPKLTFGTVWKYMIEGVSAKKKIATGKPLVKGYNFFKSGHVLKVLARHEDNKVYLRSQVLPSMKKSTVYACCFVLSSTGTVLRVHCGCPVGVDGRCNHAAATLFSLVEFCVEREKLEAESCTSKPCKWNVPRKRKGDVVPIANMTFIKHDYSKPKEKRRSLLPPGKDVRAPHQMQWSEERVKNMLILVKQYQEKNNCVAGWSHILPQDAVLESDSNEKEEKTEAAVDDFGLVSPIKEHPVSLSEIKFRCEKVKKKLMFTDEKIEQIEKQTREQSNEELWHQQRQYRITASKCHRVATRKESTSPTKIIKEVLKYNKPFQSKYMKEGLEKEEFIIQAYIDKMNGEGHKSIEVDRCGFFVSSTHGFLGASPDALVSDPSETDSKGLLEVKYIQVHENESLNEALVRKRICVQGNCSAVNMNKKHQYYFQIQQQMFVTGRKWTDFVVQGSQSSDLFCERISFTQTYLTTTLPRLEHFFDRFIAPELAYPRVKLGLAKLDMQRIQE